MFLKKKKKPPVSIEQSQQEICRTELESELINDGINEEPENLMELNDLDETESFEENEESSFELEDLKEEETVSKENKDAWILSRKDFGPLAKYVADDNITDVDWDCDSLWIKYANKRREKVEDPEVTKEFIWNFIERVAMHESVPFNPKNKSFSAETDTLRITCIHEALSPSGRCVNIRKTLPRLRFTAEQALKDNYTTEKIMAFIINCIKTQANIVVCGYPGCGKTEAVKFFSSFIPKNQKVITVEDTKEWHYKEINPGADAIEFKVRDNKDYEEAIAEALRLSPVWLMISEARSREVEYLKEGMTTGVHCITTLHTDDVRKIPARIVNMMGAVADKKQEINDMYMFLDIGIHLVEKEDGNGFIHREIDQVCYFDQDPITLKNKCYMIVNKGQLNESEIPEKLRDKLVDAIHNENIFYCEELRSRMEDQLFEECKKSNC